MNEYSYYEEEDNSGFNLVTVLSFISTWFIRIGMVIAVILFAFFLFSGKIMMALFYIFGLIVAFLFGYAIMFLIDYFTRED